MKYFIQKKLTNLYALIYLMVLRSHNLYDAKAIIKIQNKKIQKLMKRAYQIPIYRKKFESVNCTPKDFKCAEDLKKFPILTKAEIRSWIEPEINKNKEKYKHWSRVTTSGSTGTPLMICVSPKENAMLAANWIRIACENGFNPVFDKTMALKDPEIIKKRNGKDSIFQKLFGIFRRSCISFLSNEKEMFEAINKEKPDFLYIHRSKMMQLLTYVENNSLEIHKPKLIAVIGERIDKNAQVLIDKYFPGIVFSSFGMMETGACTFTPKGIYSKHTITRDTHVINIYDPEMKSKEERMIITNLFFKGFPIINYDSMDGAYTCEENGLEYITKINGRLNDMLHFRGGRTVDYHSFYSVMEKRNDILEFRIIQQTYDLIEIHLVKNKDKSITDEDICREITEEISALIGDNTINYKCYFHDMLEPDGNGKRRFIISKVN